MVQKLINSLESVLDEQLPGMGEAHPELRVHQAPGAILVMLTMKTLAAAVEEAG